MERQTHILRHTEPAQPRVFGKIHIALVRQRDSGEIAVDLVCAGEDQRGIGVALPQEFEQRDGRTDVHGEVVRGVDKAGRHRDLRREVEDSSGGRDRRRKLGDVPDIGNLDGDLAAVHRPQPCQIGFDPRTRKGVEDRHAMAVAAEPVKRDCSR